MNFVLSMFMHRPSRWDTVVASEHRAELLQRFCHDYIVVGKPKVSDEFAINIDVKFFPRSLQASSIALMKSLGEMTSPCLTPINCIPCIIGLQMYLIVNLSLFTNK